MIPGEIIVEEMKDLALLVEELSRRLVALERYLPHLRQAAAGDISPVPMRLPHNAEVICALQEMLQNGALLHELDEDPRMRLNHQGYGRRPNSSTSIKP